MDMYMQRNSYQNVPLVATRRDAKYMYMSPQKPVRLVYLYTNYAMHGPAAVGFGRARVRVRVLYGGAWDQDSPSERVYTGNVYGHIVLTDLYSFLFLGLIGFFLFSSFCLLVASTAFLVRLFLIYSKIAATTMLRIE
jgi:hypothetical protein